MWLILLVDIFLFHWTPCFLLFVFFFLCHSWHHWHIPLSICLLLLLSPFSPHSATWLIVTCLLHTHFLSLRAHHSSICLLSHSILVSLCKASRETCSSLSLSCYIVHAFYFTTLFIVHSSCSSSSSSPLLFRSSPARTFAPTLRADHLKSKLNWSVFLLIVVNNVHESSNAIPWILTSMIPSLFGWVHLLSSTSFDSLLLKKHCQWLRQHNNTHCNIYFFSFASFATCSLCAFLFLYLPLSPCNFIRRCIFASFTCLSPSFSVSVCVCVCAVLPSSSLLYLHQNTCCFWCSSNGTFLSPFTHWLSCSLFFLCFFFFSILSFITHVACHRETTCIMHR